MSNDNQTIHAKIIRLSERFQKESESEDFQELMQAYMDMHDDLVEILNRPELQPRKDSLELLFLVFDNLLKNAEYKLILNIYQSIYNGVRLVLKIPQLRENVLKIAVKLTVAINRTDTADLFGSKYLDDFHSNVCEAIKNKDPSLRQLALLLAANITTIVLKEGKADLFFSKYFDGFHSAVYEAIKDKDPNMRRAALLLAANASIAMVRRKLSPSEFWKTYRDDLHSYICDAIKDKDPTLRKCSLKIACNATYACWQVGDFFSSGLMVIELHTSVRHLFDLNDFNLDALSLIDNAAGLISVMPSMQNEMLWILLEYDWCRRRFSSNLSQQNAGFSGGIARCMIKDNEPTHVIPVLNSIGWHLPYSRVSSSDAGVGAIATVGLLSLCEDRNKQMQSPLDDLVKLKASYDDGISDLWCHYLRLYPSKFKNFEHLPSNKKPDFGIVIFKPWLWTSWWKLTRQWEQAKNPDGWKNQVENIATRQRQWLLDSWCDVVRIDAKGIRSPERLLLALWLCDWWKPNAGRDFSAVAKWDNTRPWKDKAFREKLDLKALTSLLTSEGEPPLDGVKIYSARNCEKGTPASMINVWNDDKQMATDAVIGLSLSLSNNKAWRESIESAMRDKNFDQLDQQLDQAYSEVQLELSRVLNLLITMRDSTINQSFRKKVHKWIGIQKGELIGRLVLGSAAEVMDDIIALENEPGDILSETLPESKDTYLDGISVLERRIGQMKQWHPGWQPSTDEKQKRGWMEPLSLHEWSALLLDAAPVSTAEPEALWYALERQRAILAVFSNDNKDVLALDEDAYKELFASLNSNADYTTDRSWPALEILKAHLEKIMPPIQWEDVAESLGEDVLIQLFWHSSGGEEQLSALILDQGKLVISQGSIQSRDWREKVQSLLDLKDEDLPDEFAQIVTWLNQMRRDGCKQRVIFPPDLEGIPFEALGANIIREISVHSIVRPSDCSDRSDSQGSFVASLHKREGRFLLPAVECNHVATTIKQSTGTDPELIFERVGIVHLLEQFSNRRWVHLNTHGFYENESPLDSRLSLGKGEALPLWLLTGNRISSKVLVLSSCNSLRRELAQDGSPGQDQSKAVMSAIGIGGAMRAAGAQCVVGALYPVDEQTAALWMGKFYEHLCQEETVGEAVNHARAWMMNAEECDIKQELKGLISAITEKKKRNHLSQRIDSYINYFCAKRKIIAGSFVILGDPKIKL